ncbi:CPBP family intramembrane metalloprotease [Hafnia paralvei]|jgi:uncharacterized protein|nr:CPBP family intramembrane metalloprotease [Hafnia paralvei]RDA69419.1 CPBP family intramembrane metalloprotease [Hafnia paralvei]RDA70489.1 CPBP family intramembrane metalloprotease [Hafnia paralvei]RDA70529.1 CPBP family intramembrane metalloprotease [Hafnia paralvei]RDA79757.1 CPBP family intramembrane metalloprotease [Hafnia paralvei]
MRASSFTEARFSEQLNNFPVLSFGFNYKILRELPMWGALAASLAVLSFQRQLSAFLLLSATALAFSQGILNFNALGFMAVVALAGVARYRWENQQKGGFNSEVLLVLAAVVLFLHLVPGFNNPKILDKVIAGPHSAPFSMYYNFDKALVPFILLLALPTLFRTSSTASRPYWNWLLLGISVPALLLIAVALGGLRIELHQPSWIWQFALANLFFVSLAEEALFRGYLQQRLSGWLGHLPALLITAVIFGLAHYAGGWLMVVFAGLAGVIYGIAWMWSGRLWVATLFHFGLNLIHLLFFTYPMYHA